MSAYSSPFDVKSSYSTLVNPINGPITISLIGHTFLLLLLIFGIPYVAKNPEILYEPIPVEIISSADISDDPPAPESAAAEEPPPIVKQAPTMIEEPPPEPEPDPVIESVVPEPTPPPPPIETPESEVKEEIEPTKPAMKPRRKPKPPPPKKVEKPKVEKKQKKSINTLLNNVLNEENNQPKVENNKIKQTSKSQPGIPDGVLTYSEDEAVKAQMAKCWRINSGGSYAENLKIEVRLYMRPDRTIIRHQVLNESSDPAYQAAKASALRALRNPKCVPLDLPPSKYNEWKQFKMVFNPKEMLTYQ